MSTTDIINLLHILTAIVENTKNDVIKEAAQTKILDLIGLISA